MIVNIVRPDLFYSITTMYKLTRCATGTLHAPQERSEKGQGGVASGRALMARNNATAGKNSVMNSSL